LGLTPRSHFRVEAACASGSMAVRAGWMAVKSGLADIVLVNGAEKMTELSTSEATEVMGRFGDTIWEYPFGMTFPGYYAMLATSPKSSEFISVSLPMSLKQPPSEGGA